MTVKRIVANIATENFDQARAFYGDILGLDIAMDQGWIQTYADTGSSMPQISFLSEGGSGTEVPDLSIEVDNLEEIYQKAMAANYPVLYGPAHEPWGVYRFYLQDPFGRLINILMHE